LGDATANETARFRYFGEARGVRVAVFTALFVVLALVARAARRRTHEWVANGGTPPSAAAGVGRPLAAAVMLDSGVLGFFSPPAAPRAAVAVFQLLALVPALRVTALLVPPPYVPALRVVGALFLIDVLRRFGSVVPLLEQLIFLIEMLAGVSALIWWLATRRPRGNPALAAGRSVLVFTVALAAAAAGYMSFAVLLGAGVLGSGFLGLIVYASVRVADGLVAVGLRRHPLSALVVTQRHRGLVERRIRGVLHLIGVVTWVTLTLRYFGLRGPALDLAREIADAEYRRGNLSISVGGLLAFAPIVGGTFLLSRLLRFVLQEEVYPRVTTGRGFTYAVSGLLHYILVFAGFLIGLATLGVDLTKVTILAGALGVGIGFGLQNVVNNI